ncbi:MAG TPA: FAD-dependent oxidoreductase [Steroidobacteraceae bacterium]
MSQQDAIAVVGAGIIGSAVALALAREGRKVLLLDRALPGVAGASYGNVGHIAAELVQPLPSPQLLFGFWRQLLRFGGVLDLPPSRAAGMIPWIARFARAAFRRDRNTELLSPLVLPAARDWRRWLDEIGRGELLRRNGHYEVGFGAKATEAAASQAAAMASLGVRTVPVPNADLQALEKAAGAPAVGLWFPDSAHVVDPLRAVQALADAATARGAEYRRMEVRQLKPRGDGVEVIGADAAFTTRAAVICAGMGSQPLLKSFGLHAPLQPVRGYHIEMPGHESYLDAPVVYTDEHLLVTPMSGRLRASSFMEFAATDAPADATKLEKLRALVRKRGYRCEAGGPSWVGSRPILPDYLPGIGRAPGSSRLYYAIGHQHIGLTLAPVTGDLLADLVAERTPRLEIQGFDLQRFGTS